MPIAGGEQLEHDVERTLEVPEANPTVVLEVVRVWSVVTDLQLAKGLHSNDSIEIPVHVCACNNSIHIGIPVHSGIEHTVHILTRQCQTELRAPPNRTMGSPMMGTLLYLQDNAKQNYELSHDGNTIILTRQCQTELRALP